MLTSTMKFAKSAGRLLASMVFLMDLEKERIKLWFTPETLQRIQAAKRISTTEAQKKIEVEKTMEKADKAICQFCEEEILGNKKGEGGNWSWESESLLEFCDKASGGKHKPLFK